MKKLIFILTCLSSLGANTANTITNQELSSQQRESLIKEYQEMFQKISQKRVGLDELEIAKVKSPFVKIVKKKKSGTKNAINKVPQGPTLILEAILNKKAMINGKWYGIKQSVAGMVIVSVKQDTVLLKNGSSYKKLTIRKNNANISIK